MSGLSHALVAETGPHQDFVELLKADDADNSQPPSPVEDAEGYEYYWCSDSDYEEFGAVVHQICGAAFYEKVQKLKSYKNEAKKLKADNCKLRKYMDALLKNATIGKQNGSGLPTQQCRARAQPKRATKASSTSKGPSRSTRS